MDTSTVKASPRTHELNRILADANHLLAYAVEAGIEVETDIAQRIISATQRGDSIWGDAEAGALITAITRLAAKTHPVTAETLRACREEAHNAIRNYRRFVTWLAAIVIPFSMITFINTGLSNLINKNLDTANNLLVELHSKVSINPNMDAKSPTQALLQLQHLTISARAINSRTGQLNWLLLNLGEGRVDDKLLELPRDLGDNFKDVREQLNIMTDRYQKVRLIATNAMDATSIVWGAVVACILPVLYALLGACAAVLRAFTLHTEKRTFSRSYATPARFIIAGIAGGVIGLFNINLGESLTASPLALAFLVGYATDIFFSFLEGSMQNMSKPKAPS